MIQELSITIRDGGLTHTISIDTDIASNLTYDLSEAIIEVIRMASAHPGIIIEHLIDEYGFPDSVKELANQEDSEVIWYEPNVVPNIREKVLIVYDDVDSAPIIVNSIIDSDYWNRFISNHKVKQWCYLKDALKEGYKL